MQCIECLESKIRYNGTQKWGDVQGEEVALGQGFIKKLEF